MSKQHFIAFAFLVVALIQIALPAQHVWLYERTLHEGHAFKFKTQPVDPYDAFRGRYVALRFAADSVPWEGDEAKKPTNNTKIFVRVEEGADGFAKFSEVMTNAPVDGDYLQVTTAYTYIRDKDKLQVTLPFDRFYMEESIAPKAEQVFRGNRGDGTKDAYAMVRIRSGLGVIEQVFIGDKTLAEAAKTALDQTVR